MFHLISGFYTLLTQKDEYNVLILGLDNAGKLRNYATNKKRVNFFNIFKENQHFWKVLKLISRKDIKVSKILQPQLVSISGTLI